MSILDISEQGAGVQGSEAELADAKLRQIAAAGPRAITSETPKELVREIARSPRFMALSLAALELARHQTAGMLNRQTEIGRENHAITFKATSFGEPYMRIDSQEYFAMRAKYGESCWDDPEFVEAYRRDNPYCRVKPTRGTKGQEYGGRTGREASVSHAAQGEPVSPPCLTAPASSRAALSGHETAGASFEESRKHEVGRRTPDADG